LRPGYHPCQTSQDPGPCRLEDYALWWAALSSFSEFETLGEEEDAWKDRQALFLRIFETGLRLKLQPSRQILFTTL